VQIFKKKPLSILVGGNHFFEFKFKKIAQKYIMKRSRRLKSRKTRKTRRRHLSTNKLLKILGGGDFSGTKCDLTPLRTTDEIVQKYDRGEIPEIYDHLNLENIECNLLAGAHNVVCQKRCAEGGDKSTVLIYRQTKSPYAKFPKGSEPPRPVLLTESQIKEQFLKHYHPEMKLQIELAEHDLAPNVFMYGIITFPLPLKGGTKRAIEEVDTPDSNTTKAQRADDTQRPYYLFSIMEKKLDTFELFGYAFNEHCASYVMLQRNPSQVEHSDKMQRADLIINSVWRGTLDLYMKVSDYGRLYFDLKMENTVAEIRGKNIKIFMIDCDPRFIISENALVNAIRLAKFNPTPENVAKLRKKIMLYLFSATVISNLPENCGFNDEVAFPIMTSLTRFAFLRNKINPTHVFEHHADTVAVLSALYDHTNDVFADNEKIIQRAFIGTIQRYNICSKPHICFLPPSIPAPTPAAPPA
jgi:hypothetical protein